MRKTRRNSMRNSRRKTRRNSIGRKYIRKMSLKGEPSHKYDGVIERLLSRTENPIISAIASMNKQSVIDAIKNHKDKINVILTHLCLTPLIVACYTGNLEFVKLLLNAGADCNLENTKSGLSPLMYACILGYDKIVMELLKCNSITINYADHCGYTALMYACWIANLDIVKALVSKSNSVNMVNEKNGLTTLMMLFHDHSIDGNCMSLSLRIDFLLGHVESFKKKEEEFIKKGPTTPLLEFLLSKLDTVNINKKCANGGTAFMYACKNGTPLDLYLLIEKGAEVNDRNNMGMTPLMYAFSYNVENMSYLPKRHVVENRYVDENTSGKVSFLISKGCDVNDKDSYGTSVLMYACNSGYLDIVKYLIEIGAKVNDIDHAERPLIYYAFKSENINLVKYLVEEKEAFVNEDVFNGLLKDAYDPLNFRNNKKNLAKLVLEYTYKSNFKLKCSYSDKCDHFIYFLIESVVPRTTKLPSYVSEKEKLLLRACTSVFCLPMVKYLIEIDKVDVNYATPQVFTAEVYKTTPLMVACENGILPTVEYLISKGANLNNENNKGFTALMLAANKNENTDIVHRLLSNGADDTIKNCEGKTAFNIASGRPNFLEEPKERTWELLKVKINYRIISSAFKAGKNPRTEEEIRNRPKDSPFQDFFHRPGASRVLESVMGFLPDR